MVLLETGDGRPEIDFFHTNHIYVGICGKAYCEYSLRVLYLKLSSAEEANAWLRGVLPAWFERFWVSWDVLSSV